MRLFEAIKAENREILRTLSLLEDSTAGDPESRSRLLDALRVSIAEQNRIAEDYIYPIFTAAERGRELVERSRHELSEIDRAVEDATHWAMDDSGIKYRIGALSGQVRAHLTYETEELLPQADRLLGDDEEKALIEVITGRNERIAHKLRPH